MGTEVQTQVQTDERGRAATFVETAYGKVEMTTGGDGPPLLVLHRDSGSGAWNGFHDTLATHFSVYSPSLPGFGASDRPMWAREARDLGIITLGLLRELGLPPVTVVACGFGGWVAAEMASMAPATFAGLVLVGSMGVKPPEGEILDQFFITTTEYVQAGFTDLLAFAAAFGDPPTRETLESWETAREMCTRVAWKPYMFNQRLTQVLPGVPAPALVVWGDADRVVPYSCAQVFVDHLPNARLATVAGGGHQLEHERRAELVELIRSFQHQGGL